MHNKMGQNVQTASSTPLGSTNREKPALCGLFHFPQCLCGLAGISRGLPVPCGTPQPCRFCHHAAQNATQNAPAQHKSSAQGRLSPAIRDQKPS